MANRSDRLAGFYEQPGELNRGVDDAQVFRRASAGNQQHVELVNSVGFQLGERDVDREGSTLLPDDLTWLDPDQHCFGARAFDGGHWFDDLRILEVVRDDDRDSFLAHRYSSPGRSRYQASVASVSSSERLSFRLRIIVMACSTGTAPRSSPVRKRIATAPASASRLPITSMNGIFLSCAFRIFACIRSRPSSTSARIPASFNCWATALA